MLRTNSHNLSNWLHVVKNVDTKRFCLAISWLKQACKQTNRRGFASTIVTKQHKNLVRVHFKVNTIDSFKSIVILLKQIRYFKYFSLVFLNKNFARNRLKAFRLQVFSFKALFICRFLFAVNHFNLVARYNLMLFVFISAGPRTSNEKQRMFTLPISFRHC